MPFSGGIDVDVAVLTRRDVVVAVLLGAAAAVVVVDVGVVGEHDCWVSPLFRMWVFIGPQPA